MRIDTILDKIERLDAALGASFRYELLEPFHFDANNLIDIQRAAGLIGQHLSLKQHTFVITFAKQKENVGGHVDLADENGVFIEIDERFKGDNRVILSILAHEISHKFLQQKKIFAAPTLENEILTDVTTIYTGMGKLTLNGCLKVTKQPIKKDGRMYDQSSQENLGYLELSEFAFTYLLINKLNGVPATRYQDVLVDHAIAAINRVENTCSYYFDGQLYDTTTDLTQDKSFEDLLSTYQKTLSDNARDLKQLQHLFIDEAWSAINRVHVKLKYQRPKETNNSETLKRVLMAHARQKVASSVEADMNQVSTLLKACHKLINYQSGETPERILRTFDCPACSKAMKISASKIVKVKCPECNYQFIVNTTTEKNAQPLTSGLKEFFNKLRK